MTPGVPAFEILEGSEPPDRDARSRLRLWQNRAFECEGKPGRKHPERLMSEWILSLEPEHRPNRWVTPRR
jgi:hypothetical protein